MLQKSFSKKKDRDAIYASWENLDEESYRDFGICLFHLDQSKKVTFFVVTIFNLGHLKSFLLASEPMYDSE